MKRITRVVTAALLILVLLLTAIPASAGDNKTPVTGNFYFTGEPYENPNARLWFTGRYGWLVNQCRYDYLQSLTVTTDNRLNGVADSIVNCFFHYNSDGSLAYAHLWGKSTTYQYDNFTVPKWECTTNGFIDSQWNNVTYVVCRGVGVNAGLNAKFSMIPDPVTEGTYTLQGYILEP